MVCSRQNALGEGIVILDASDAHFGIHYIGALRSLFRNISQSRSRRDTQEKDYYLPGLNKLVWLCYLGSSVYERKVVLLGI